MRDYQRLLRPIYHWICHEISRQKFHDNTSLIYSAGSKRLTALTAALSVCDSQLLKRIGSEPCHTSFLEKSSGHKKTGVLNCEF